jgi:hypothetical protein
VRINNILKSVVLYNIMQTIAPYQANTKNHCNIVYFVKQCPAKPSLPEGMQ